VPLRGVVEVVCAHREDRRPVELRGAGLGREDVSVKLSTVGALARTRCRNALSAVLKMMPAAMFSPIRSTFATLEPGTLRFRLQRQILGVVRYRGVPPDIESFVLSDNRNVRFVNADSYVVERLYWFGEKHGYEPEVVRWWRQYCGRSASILEMGANIGYFTVQGAKAAPGARYVAVEPHPNCAAVCRENIRINGITNAEVVEAAAVAQCNAPSVTLRTPGGRSRDHYRAPCTGYVGTNEMHSEDAEGEAWGSIAVAAADVADLVGGVDLLKMDIEGQEFSLLSSIADVIATAHPTMFLELLDDTPKLRTFITDLCAATDYRCFVPTNTHLIPLSASEIPSISLTDAFGTRDIILTCDVVPDWLGVDPRRKTDLASGLNGPLVNRPVT
jgi:FkbM family methyltransferase